MVTLNRQSVPLFSNNYRRAQKLYLEVFPPEERLPFFFLMLKTHQSIASAYAYYHEQKFVGFAYLFQSKDYVFVVYLGVNPKHHSQGFGSQILSDLKRVAAGRQIVLSIEPMDPQAENYQQRLKRLAFYERNGFQLTQDYYQENQERFQFMVSDPAINWKAFEKLLQKAFTGLATITFL